MFFFLSQNLEMAQFQYGQLNFIPINAPGSVGFNVLRQGSKFIISDNRLFSLPCEQYSPLS